jgi:GxxExxY protein
MAITVHRALGPGLLESAYQGCMLVEMIASGMGFESEKWMNISYKGSVIACAFRIDLLVEKRLVVELKAVTKLEGIHVAQVLTYMRLSGTRNGLIINFNTHVLTDGIRRLVVD